MGADPGTESAKDDNSPGDNMAEVGKTDFDFYAKFAKPLILGLNCTEDRILAAAWFSKLKDETSGPEQLRLDYLKLLLFVLQRHRLAGPFSENPNAQEQLDPFGDDYELAAVARQIIEKEQQEKKEHYLKKIRGEIGDWPPYSTDFSPDLKEYVAAQDIPNFGVHVYYAISKDPILDWDKAEHAVFPRSVRRMEPQGHISETSFAVMEPKPDTPEEEDKCKIFEETGVMPDKSIFMGRKTKARKSPYKDIDRPAPPLGVLPAEGQEDKLEQELPPPTWGSNLIEVREPLDLEGPETPPPEEDSIFGAGVADTSLFSPDADDPEIVQLLETSFNMEDILAEVDAVETEEPPMQEDEVDPVILEEQQKFREIEADLDRHDAIIAEALAALDDDEKRMLMEMEAEEAAGLEPRPKPSPKKQVKVVADDDTVIQVLVENPEVVTETKEEKKRKEAKAAVDKKKKPPGRTGLNKLKAKGAILNTSEKKEIEEQEKAAKVVETKKGIPIKRPGVPKPKTPKVQVTAAVSEGEIPSEKPSTSSTGKTVSGKGKAIPGKGIPRKGIPKKATAGTAEMKEMKERLEQKLQETREAYPEKFDEEVSAPVPQVAPEEEEEVARARTPVDEAAAVLSPGSPESDDIYDEMDREFQILERLCQLYEQLDPNKPEGLRTPPLFSKHPEIRRLGRQLRYRADEFQVHPLEKYQPAEEYFAGAGAAPPSPFFDPREAMRTRPVPPSEVTVPDMAPPTVAVESPPWAKIEELKKIAAEADKGLDASPAISAGVGLTTPRSPATPRRPMRRDMFEMESPPEYESPPVSPSEDPTHGLPEVMTHEQYLQMHAQKQAEEEAYIQAEMEAERQLWAVLAPKAPTPPPPPPPPPMPPPVQPQRLSPVAPGPVTTPQRRPSPKAPTPPSVGGPGAIVRTPGTPEGLPPSMRYQYVTPPKYKAPVEKFIIPEPEFEEFDPLQHEDIIFQTMPDLVEADLDEFDTSYPTPKFELQDWLDPLEPLKQILADEEEPIMIFDSSDEMTEMDLVPAEEDYRQYSPVITLQERLIEHEIPQEFYDKERPKAKSREVQIGSRKIQLARKSKPSQLAREIIREDLLGEEAEDLINAEEEAFLNRSLGDPDRVEYMKQMADQAQDIGALEEEEPPDMFEADTSFGPPSPPPPIQTPPFGRGKDVLLFTGLDETDEDEIMFAAEEPEFLIASPGMPSPPPPPTPPPPTPPPPPPPPGPESPPWAPPFETFMQEDIFGEEDEGFLVASPEMPPGRTFEDDLREIGSPVKLGPARWELPTPPRAPVPVAVPVGPLARPVGPGDMPLSPTGTTRRGIPAARMRPPSPVGTPEFDPEALRQEMMRHRVYFPEKEQFKAGEREIPRRVPLQQKYFPIREHMGYEESKYLHRPVEDYRRLMSRLPPAPPTPPSPPYPEELMGIEHSGRFVLEESLLDEALPPEESLSSPLAPARSLIGWAPTPPELKIRRRFEDYIQPSPEPEKDLFDKMAPQFRTMYTEDDAFIDLREEDVFPEELQESYHTPRVPAYLQATPPEPLPSMAMPRMDMEQQRLEAEQRAQWQAQQIAERASPRPPPRPSPARPSPPRQVQPSPPRQPQPPPRMPSPPVQAAHALGAPPCASPKVLKRVRDTTYSSEVYDPNNPEVSQKFTKGKTTLEFNRPEEGERRGAPVSAPEPPAAAVQMPMPRPVRRQIQQPRARRLPQLNREDEAERLRIRKRLFQGAETPEQPQPTASPSGAAAPPPARRVCPGALRGERIEIVEEFEETEYIPEHLRGYRWMDEPDADEFYRTFKQQFR